ncbi:hypothetical protein J6590_053958 [Homalodisca vitripennis]|nr:hypothetical protein J6590_053958 [Homalodisca vitripennis]
MHVFRERSLTAQTSWIRAFMIQVTSDGQGAMRDACGVQLLTEAVACRDGRRGDAIPRAITTLLKVSRTCVTCCRCRPVPVPPLYGRSPAPCYYGRDQIASRNAKIVPVDRTSTKLVNSGRTVETEPGRALDPEARRRCLFGPSAIQIESALPMMISVTPFRRFEGGYYHLKN